MVSQIKGLWSGMVKLADDVQRDLHIDKAKVDLSRVVFLFICQGLPSDKWCLQLLMCALSNLIFVQNAEC